MENFTPIATLKKKKKINKLLIIGNLLLVIIMAIGGYFYYNNVLLTKEQKAEVPSGIPEPWPTNNKCPDGSEPSARNQTEGCPGGGYLIENICGTGENKKWYTVSTANCGPATYTGAFGCPAGTNISCGPYTDAGAMLDVGGPGSGTIGGTSGIGTCNTYAPILWAGPGGNCQINCLCCPTGTRYSCTTSSNTYEYATVSNRQYICKDNNHADKYISSRPNPAYNPSLPPEDQTGVCFEDGLNNQGQPKWKCLKTLTTCAPSVCSCGTEIAVSPTPIPTATDVPVLTNTPIPTNTPTSTPTNTPTATPIISNTPTVTPLISNTPTVTPLISNTPTVTPLVSNTPGPSATPIPVLCGTKSCDNATNPCRSGYNCVQANDGSNYCTSPDFTDACKANPSYNACCIAPGQPTATPTEIILAKVSTSPTTVVKLLQTGMIQSFMYFIPAIIMLVGLIL